MDLIEMQSLLTELEQVLAGAEELRYRIQCELKKTGQEAPQSQQRQQPQSTARRGETPAAPHNLDTSSLVRTGSGLWAWEFRQNKLSV